jgi:hypothetical protein
MEAEVGIMLSKPRNAKEGVWEKKQTFMAPLSHLL